MTHKASKRNARHTNAETLIFAAWTDTAPSLLRVAASPSAAREWIDGYNYDKDDAPACTLADILADPDGHGVGQRIGGL